LSQVDGRKHVAEDRQILEVALTENGGFTVPGQADRLVAMHGFFAAPFVQVPDDLYSTIERGTAVRERSAVVVHPHGLVSTNTYWGRFPASYWQRWTRVAEVTVTSTVTGSGTVSVLASDYDGESRVVSSHRVQHAQDQQLRFAVALDKFVDGGALWLEVATDDAPLGVRDVQWWVANPPRRNSTAVVLCTYNRPDDCLFTLRTLAENVESLLSVDAVYVVDQGEQTVHSRPEFDRVRQLFGTRLHYRRQANLGGAGGFTRGLYEAEDGTSVRQTNVLFMDDDILLEPDTVVRMSAFANFTAEPVIVGAQMLRTLHPKRFHVSAETADFTPLLAGQPAPGSLHNVDLTEERQELRVDADYNAWWCCLLPAEIVADVGYPLPMFLQWDDVEYGYRARAHGHATVALPGAAVWHADFDWKDEDSWVRYLSLRNALIINALHGDFRPKQSARIAMGWILRCLVAMRYGQAAILIKAIEDFLAGPAVLDDGGRRAVAAARALHATYQETVRHPACDVDSVPFSRRVIAKSGPAPSWEAAVLAKRLVWQLSGRTTGQAAISHADAHWWHVSLFESAVVTDASQEAVRACRLDRSALVSLGRQALRAAWRLCRDGRHLRRRWQHAAHELSTRDNWARLFAMSGEPGRRPWP
jgi:galactofuranosylgalactofuranosylrhamnosyl-N-acetylglucosaminyl-diphospho-decaprenol beta-1,5/1,6-galactofuranosyltransferase